MYKWFVAVITIVLLALAQPVLGQTGVEYVNGIRLQGHEYMDSTGKVTLHWDVVPQAQAYRIRVIMFDKIPNTTYAMGQTPDAQMEILRPRSGHFRFEAQTCRYIDCHCEPDANPDPCTDDLSGWAQSTDPAHATVDGIPMGWWLYWKTPAPIFN